VAKNNLFEFLRGVMSPAEQHCVIYSFHMSVCYKWSAL